MSTAGTGKAEAIFWLISHGIHPVILPGPTLRPVNYWRLAPGCKKDRDPVASFVQFMQPNQGTAPIIPTPKDTLLTQAVDLRTENTIPRSALSFGLSLS
jgi:hypothetical protein